MLARSLVRRRCRQSSFLAHLPGACRARVASESRPSRLRTSSSGGAVTPNAKYIFQLNLTNIVHSRRRQAHLKHLTRAHVACRQRALIKRRRRRPASSQSERERRTNVFSFPPSARSCPQATAHARVESPPTIGNAGEQTRRNQWKNCIERQDIACITTRPFN